MSASKTARKMEKSKAPPKGYAPAFFRPHYAKEWGTFGRQEKSAESLRMMGFPYMIERREGDVIIIYKKKAN
ncbi:MAG: hypothetical protein ABF443_14265 [Acetobacter malorum]|uniref:hypothetical protein n=1 Tax=Acetobacter malorum TaxID=178901 RepID=UPI0039EB11AF